jgi:hypothetical protein
MTSGMPSTSASPDRAHAPGSFSADQLPTNHPSATIPLLGDRLEPEHARERCCPGPTKPGRRSTPSSTLSSAAPPSSAPSSVPCSARRAARRAGRPRACRRILAAEAASLKTHLLPNHLQLFDFADFSRLCESRHMRCAKDRQYSILDHCVPRRRSSSWRRIRDDSRRMEGRRARSQERPLDVSQGPQEDRAGSGRAAFQFSAWSPKLIQGG